MSIFGNKFEANLEERVKIGEDEFAVGARDMRFLKGIRGQLYISRVLNERTWLGFGPRKLRPVVEMHIVIIDQDEYENSCETFISSIKQKFHRSDFLGYLAGFGLTKQMLKPIYGAIKNIYKHYESQYKQ